MLNFLLVTLRPPYSKNNRENKIKKSKASNKLFKKDYDKIESIALYNVYTKYNPEEKNDMYLMSFNSQCLNFYNSIKINKFIIIFDENLFEFNNIKLTINFVPCHR